jgi:hypothetical protein
MSNKCSKLIVGIASIALLWSAGIVRAQEPVVLVAPRDWEAVEGSGSAEFQIWADSKVSHSITVNLEISGSAENGVDYSRINETATIGSGNRYTSIDISPKDDNEFEGTENIIMKLLPGDGYTVQEGRGFWAQIDIFDDEAVEVEFKGWGKKEKESVTDPGITVTLNKSASEEVRVGYTVQAALASAGTDYVLPDTGTIVFAPGEREKPLGLQIVDDNVAEDDETLIIRLHNVRGVNLGRDARFTYIIENDDGEVERSEVYDKMLGAIVCYHAANVMGYPVETYGWNNIGGDWGRGGIEDKYGWLDELPDLATEDGAENGRNVVNAIVRKMDRVNADTVLNQWMIDWDINDLEASIKTTVKTVYPPLGQGHNPDLWRYCKWGCTADEYIDTRFGGQSNLTSGRHYVARVLTPVGWINPCDPYHAKQDMMDIGRIYYPKHGDDEPAYDFGGVFHAAVTYAMIPGISVDEVLERALEWGSDECQKEMRLALSVADKYIDDPKNIKFRRELCDIWASSSSKYYAKRRMSRWWLATVYENVGVALACFKVSQGDAKLASELAVNYGRDADCCAASAGALAGAYAGFKKLPPEWIDIMDNALHTKRPQYYSNCHITLKAMADIMYRAAQNVVERYRAEVTAAGGGTLPEELQRKKEHVELMDSLGVSTPPVSVRGSRSGIFDMPLFTVSQTAADRLRITYTLPNATSVSLNIFDLSGKSIATIVNREIKAGNGSIEWKLHQKNTPLNATGVYVCRIQAGGYRACDMVTMMR